MAFARPATTLRAFVGGLDVGATEPDLYAAFARVGVQLAHIELVVNPATGCRRGFAFVVLAGLPIGANADAVLTRMRLALVDGRPVTVQRIPSELTSTQSSARVELVPLRPH
jgi:RNA recognition motif-containing protein